VTVKPFMEQVVSDYAMEMIDEDESLCGYPRCRREVVAIALNDVKPKYDVATDKNLLNVPVPELIARFMDDASVAVRKALEQVKERPNE
jgi:competence protein ComFB